MPLSARSSARSWTRRARLGAVAVTLALVGGLAGCGSDDGSGDGSGDGAAQSEESPAPVATATSKSGVVVTGAPGAKPTVKAPDTDAPTELETEVLVEGTGRAVGKGDLLVADYLGQTWAANKVFDNSFDRGEPAGFGIGVGQVIKGWDQGLVGQKVGSRVLLSIPAALGYGEQGNPQAGITGEDTLVFVVDIVDTFGADLAASGTPATAAPDGLPAVSTTPGKKPTVTLAKGATAPTEARSAVVVAGDGKALDPAKNVVAQVLQVDAVSGKTLFESWGRSPLALKAAQVPGLAEALKGQNVGSRVVLAIPAQEQNQPASVVVLDIVGMF